MDDYGEDGWEEEPVSIIPKLLERKWVYSCLEWANEFVYISFSLQV